MERSLADRLCAFAGRGACTDAERRAAAMLHDDLRARGHEAWVEARWTRPQADAALLLGAGLAVIASLVSVAAPLAAAIGAGVAAISLVVEAAGRSGPIRLLLPQRATQHVLTVPSGDGVVLVVAAGYDAPRGGWLRRLPRAREAAAACAVLVAALAAARAAGVSGTWLGAVQLVPTLGLLAAVAGAIDGVAAGWTQGAGQARAVELAVAVFDELARVAPDRLAPALLLHGAAAPGPQARRAHLRAEKWRPRDAVLLELTPGARGWATRHSQLRAAAERVGGEKGRLRPPAGAARHPAIAVGAADPAAIDVVLGIVDALDADLAKRTSTAAG